MLEVGKIFFGDLQFGTDFLVALIGICLMFSLLDIIVNLIRGVR